MTIHHECYVSLEVAKLLKEAGFDWKQYSFYNSKGILVNGTFAANWNDKIWYIDGSKVSAPNLEVAQRWLREIKNVWVEVLLVNATDPHYRVDLVNASKYNNLYGIIHDADYKEYEIPEEAQEAGIKKALELILEKGE